MTATVDETTRPRRLSLSQILEMVLTRGSRDRSSVSLARTASGATTIDVKVHTGDEEIETVEDAERRAAEVYERLRELYPERDGHDNSEVTLTRNAKGETQVSVSIKSGETGPRTIAGLTEAAVREYDRLRMGYPMANGYTAKPGSVADLPPRAESDQEGSGGGSEA
jgi:hypothetical protein